MSTNKKRRTMRTVFSAVVIGFAVISFWRGIWGLMDLYLFPNNYELSLWVSVLMGVVILYFTKHLIDELI
ncbi:hypothetical protein LCGC14_1895110 [marine sediment metagenome]|uniref:Uncharacterized protein n=1 Tax=marine sediment metagenome TaxID=412755 RepID=A0A0F9IC61_9ZZZZ